jgi:hypothetical protein
MSEVSLAILTTKINVVTVRIRGVRVNPTGNIARSVMYIDVFGLSLW